MGWLCLLTLVLTACSSGTESSSVETASRSLYSGWPAIFYAPHPDDEAIAMAGAIRQHKETGRPVFVVLLTNGGGDQDLLRQMNGQIPCSIPGHGTHRFGLTEQAMREGRRQEFLASTKALGVDRVFIMDFDDDEPWSDLGRYTSRVQQTIQFMESMFPGASHKLSSGFFDTIPASISPGTPRNNTHLAQWNAAHNTPNITDFAFYRSYAYYYPAATRVAQNPDRVPQVLDMSQKPAWMAAKRAALDEYKRFDPASNRFALGYHSTRDLIDQAYADTREFMDAP